MIHNKKSKKAMFLIPFVAIAGFLIILTTLILVSVNSANDEIDNIGDRQYELIQTNQIMESHRFYISQSAKYVISDTINEVGESSGFVGESPCGDYNGVNLLNSQDTFCYPDYLNALSLKFNEKLNLYIQNYNITQIPEDNYVISLGNSDTLIFIAKQPARVYLSNESYYEDLLSFKLKLDNPLPFNELFGQAEELINTCSNEELGCIQDNLPEDWALIESDANSKYHIFIAKINSHSLKFALSIQLKNSKEQ